MADNAGSAHPAAFTTGSTGPGSPVRLHGPTSTEPSHSTRLYGACSQRAPPESPPTGPPSCGLPPHGSGSGTTGFHPSCRAPAQGTAPPTPASEARLSAPPSGPTSARPTPWVRFLRPPPPRSLPRHCACRRQPRPARVLQGTAFPDQPRTPALSPARRRPVAPPRRAPPPSCWPKYPRVPEGQMPPTPAPGPSSPAPAPSGPTAARSAFRHR